MGVVAIRQPEMRCNADASILLVLILFASCLLYKAVYPQQIRLLRPMHVPGNQSPISRHIASNLGVYATSGVGKDIIVLSANYAYAEFVVNWLCTSRHISSLKAIVVAENPELHNLLRTAGVPSIDGRLFNISASTLAHAYGSRGFNTISNMKLRAVQALLELGINVLFTDGDVVFKRDPFLYLRHDVDFEFQADNINVHDEFLLGDNPCTGLYYMKANNRTIDFLKRSFDLRHNDQENVRRTLNTMTAAGEATYIPHTSRAPQTGKTLTFRQLPPLSFPNGVVLNASDFEQRRAAADVPLVTVHANWLQGQEAKRSKLHELGLWRVSQTVVSCTGQPNCYGKVGKYWLQCAQEDKQVMLPLA